MSQAVFSVARILVVVLFCVSGAQKLMNPMGPAPGRHRLAGLEAGELGGPRVDPPGMLADRGPAAASPP
jgi:uncharacterized membrane protein YphA (DoxX/SURF4 family)